jgi:sensor domain CHASE-containing protein/nitrogen-specific signal transduction histidine kinase
MRLRQKTLAVVCGTVIILLLATYFVSQNVLVSGFAELERQNTQENVERAVSALNAEISSLSRLVHDWSAWDDTYAFVQDNNTAYMEANLGDDTFSHYKISLITHINSSGYLVYAKTFDLQSQTEVPVSQSFIESVSTSDMLWRFNDTEGHIDGILPLQEGPMLISSRPIITSNYEGPIVGAIMLGRTLDSQEISSLSEQVHLPLVFQRFDDTQLPADFQAAHSQLSDQKPIWVKPLNSDDVAGYALLKDVYGTPILMLRADMARDIFSQGLTTISYVAFSFLAAGMMFTVLLILLLEKLVLNRLAQLSKTIRQIGKSGELSRRVHIKGKDELSDLSCEFNNMLSTLEDTKNTLKKHTDHLEELVEEKTNKLRQVERMAAIGQIAAMVGHDLRSPLAGIRNAVYYLKTRAGPQLDEKEKQMLEIIDDNVTHSSNITSDLLDFSREIKLEKKLINLKALVQHSLMLANIPKNVEVKDLVPDNIRVEAAADKMERVFTNIIKNAAESMPNGGLLTIAISIDGENLSISLTDTGVGMPNETLQKLWTVLFTTKTRGIGLGLVICKRYIEAHGGTITVTSTLGKGTTFTVTLPAATQDNKKHDTDLVGLVPATETSQTISEMRSAEHG